MGIISNNSYVVHNEHFDRMGANRRQIHLLNTNKSFVLGMIQELFLLSTFNKLHVDNPAAPYPKNDPTITSTVASPSHSMIPTFLNLNQISK